MGENLYRACGEKEPVYYGRLGWAWLQNAPSTTPRTGNRHSCSSPSATSLSLRGHDGVVRFFKRPDDAVMDMTVRGGANLVVEAVNLHPGSPTLATYLGTYLPTVFVPRWRRGGGEAHARLVQRWHCAN
jgi:hypothetical protein